MLKNYTKICQKIRKQEMRKFNLLFTSLSGEIIGGGQRSLFLHLERLNRKRFEPFLICPSGGNLVEKAKKIGIETSILKMGRLKTMNVFTVGSTVRRLRQFIKENKINLIHTDAPRQTFYAGLAARKTGTPLIWHVRVSNPEKTFYDRFLLNLSTKVIAVSQAARNRFQRLPTAPDKCIVVYNGVDLSEFHQHQKDQELIKKLETKDECLLVGTVGQLIPSKGQDVFVMAAAEISKLVPEVKFLIVGNGNITFKKNLEDLSQNLGISKNIFFTGFSEDMPRIMSTLDIVVLPSTTHQEGFSRVILEAMASAKPVVATNIGGNPEAVEDGTTGILVPPGDPHQLAKALLELINDAKKRKLMGEAGRARAETLYGIENTVASIEKIYEEILCPDT